MVLQCYSKKSQMSCSVMKKRRRKCQRSDTHLCGNTLPLENTKTNQPVISSSCIHYLSVSQLNKTSSKQYWDSNSFLSCPVVPWFPGILNYIHYLNALGCQSGKYGIKEKKKKSKGRRKEYLCLIICYEQRLLQRHCQFSFASMSKRSTGPCQTENFSVLRISWKREQNMKAELIIQHQKYGIKNMCKK